MSRPLCPKCSGKLAPLRELDGRVTAVRCLNCGHHIYRDHPRRAPVHVESDTKIGRAGRNRVNPQLEVMPCLKGY